MSFQKLLAAGVLGALSIGSVAWLVASTSLAFFVSLVLLVAACFGLSLVIVWALGTLWPQHFR